MKLSKFNIFIENSNSNYIFNSLTNALAKFDKTKYDNLLSQKVDISDNLSELIRCGFIVKDEDDEIGKYLQIRNKKIKNDKTLRITIAPTLDCNFRCIYCFEKHLNEYMNLEVIKLIEKFVTEQLKTKRYKKLFISWYGGEPMLGLEVIKELSEYFRNICRDNNVLYNAYMVTNGYLINSTNVNDLVEMDIREIQITIDGVKSTHGKRRILYKEKEKNTYDTIINAINLLTKQGLNVNIRVNIDKENKDEISKMFDEFDKVINEKSKVRIYPGKLFCMPSTESRCNNLILNENEFVDVLIYFEEQSKKRGFHTKKRGVMPQLKPWYCTAPYGNSMVFAPNGEIYACWNDIGQKDFAIGNLKKRDIFFKMK